MATKKPAVEATPAPAAEPLPSAAEARVELGRALRVYQAFAAADRVLAVLENAEQVIAERQQMAAGATRMKDEAQAALDKALDDLAAAKQEAKDVRADTKQKAANLLDEARAQAQEIVREANEKLKEVTDLAVKKAGEVVDAKRQLAVAMAELEATQQRIADAKRDALARFGS